MSRGARRGWLRLTIEYTCIDGLPGTRNHLKIQLVAVDFDQHEASIAIEPFLHLVRRLQVLAHEFGGVSQNKVIDVVLRLNSLVNMFVPRKNQVHPVSFKKWSELGPQIEIWTMGASRVKQRMVEVADLPFGFCILQILVNPA